MRFINIINTISMTLLATSSLTLWAGQRVGNGGFIVNCPNNPEVPVNGLHLLDYLDGELRFPALGKVNLPLDGDAESKARFVFERLKRVDPIRAEKYLAELDHFFDPEVTRFLPQGYSIPTAGDFGDTMTPTNCTIVQVVANTIPTEPEEPKYWINQPLWDQLNDLVKAGLIIHEIVYNDALLRGHSTSERARYFTFLISSDKILTIDQRTYDERVLKNELGEYTWYTDNLFRYSIDYAKYRYFENLKMNLSDAHRFCDSLPGASLLGSGNFFNQKFLGSAIAHHIFRDVAEQKLDIWISSPRMGTTGNSLIIDEDIESISNIYLDDETKQKGFICIVDTRSL